MLKKKMKLWTKIGIGLLGLMVILCGAFYIYTLDYYRASDYVEALIEASNHDVQVQGNLTIIRPEVAMDKEVGLAFYPGGKVEARAYTPLLLQLADEGITCVLIEMPMNLAVFNNDGAEDAFSALPEIKTWYLAGHSLGGAMASAYIEKNSDGLEGLILLGAYPLNEAEVDTLVLYGTYDIQLDLSSMYLADEVHEIMNGNHAQFGDYGIQEGDGKALISREEQQRIAVAYIKSFIEK